MSDDPIRMVLEGVPKVNFFEGNRCPEDVPFPACVRAYLEFMGDSYGCDHVLVNNSNWKLGCTYAYIMGTSGAAFCLSWKKGWHGDNVAIKYMSSDPSEPFRRAFESVGYAYESYSKTDNDEARFRKLIIESLCDKGRPVFAFGVIGPPECCLITGYDEHGDVLIGWNFFQNFPEFSNGVDFEPSGYFRKRDWFKDMEGIIIVGEKQEKPSLNDIYREALNWDVKVVRTPEFYDENHHKGISAWQDRYNGLSAYSAWADSLSNDDDFATDDMPMLWKRFIAHDDVVGIIAEARWYGSMFIAQIAKHIWNMSEDLYKSASCYAAEHDLMWQIWNLVGGIGHGEDRVKNLAKPDIRKQIISVILKARDKDAEAVDHVEKALAKASVNY